MFDSLIKLFEDNNLKAEDGFEKIVEECEDLECRTTWSGRRRMHARSKWLPSAWLMRREEEDGSNWR